MDPNTQTQTEATNAFLNKIPAFLKKKKVLAVIIPLGLLLLITFSMLLSTKQTPQDSQEEAKKSTTQTTPTSAVVPTGSKQPLPTIAGLTISSTTPSNNQTEVGIFPPISVVFDSPVSKANQSLFHITLSPAIEGSESWSADGKTLMITPSSPLVTEKAYTAKLTSEKSIYLWSFTTISVDELSQEDQVKAQELADRNYREIEAETDRKYPWLEQFPLEASIYYFYFDVEKKSFVGQIYPKQSSTTSQDDQVNAAKAEILSRLNALGIPTTYPFVWEITPEP